MTHLIDADALIESFRETVRNAIAWGKRADEEINKFSAMRAIVDFTEAKLRVESMPTVDAIPIEWIEQWKEKLELNEEFSEHSDYIGYAITCLLEEWEKQNEDR